MVMHEDQLGVADFYPSSDIGIVYVSEADQVMGNMYRRKLAKLRKVRQFNAFFFKHYLSVYMV